MKFSLTCDKEKVLYAKNPHYGWQLCTEAQTSNFPNDRVQFARDFIGKEVVLNSGGSRNKTLATSDAIRDDTMISETIPIEYSQENGTCENSCVWLAACLVVRSVDVDLASILIEKYNANQKNSSGCVSLAKELRIVTRYTNFFNGQRNASLVFVEYKFQKNLNQ